MTSPSPTNTCEAVTGRLAAPIIKVGRFHAYFIYDVADTIDLALLEKARGDDFQKAQLNLKAVSSPSYIQFTVPPLVVQIPQTSVEGLAVEAQAKLYDYGTVAIRLSFEFSGTWEHFSEFARETRQSDGAADCARRLLNHVLQQSELALNKKHEPLVEDYFVIEVEAFEPCVTSRDLLECHRGAIASLLLSENRQLTTGEQDEALRIHFSYYESDLVVINWDSAFVFDSREGAEAVESILEFANTQLVELRTYDARLDAELDEIYKWNITRARPHWLWGRRAAEQRADQLRCLLVDIRELADRGSNALKVIGDAFYARLYRGASLRLCLSEWQQQIESKLSSVGEVYRFANDETQHTRSEFLEIIIIALIVTEIFLAIFGVGH